MTIIQGREEGVLMHMVILYIDRAISLIQGENNNHAAQ
jgi:hypothetical protein